ncbi:MAG: hypothetical protein ACI8Z9_001353, partial [Paraglaciecola sp.]
HYQLDADSCRLVATEQSMSALIMRDVNAAPLKIMPSKLKIFSRKCASVPTFV